MENSGNDSNLYLDHEVYLSDTKQRIEHFREIIAGRPAVIIAAGPSLSQLEERILECSQADVCYIILNRFWVQEDSILAKAGKRADIIVYSDGTVMKQAFPRIKQFLSRDNNNLFISSWYRDTFSEVPEEELRDTMEKYDKKLLFFSLGYSRNIPNHRYPLHFTSGNTLQIAVQITLLGRAEKIVIFGADGGWGKELYVPLEKKWYRISEYYTWNSPKVQGLIDDARMCFNPIVPIGVRNTQRTYKLDDIPIYICSPHSGYTPFQLISYDDAIDLLNGRINEVEKDYRFPNLSIIINFIGADKCDIERALEYLKKQTYSCYEMIILDDGNRDFNNISLGLKVTTVNCQNLQAGLKKVSGIIQGQYITLCSPRHLPANPDWHTIAIDVMENIEGHDLIWGCTQELSETTCSPGRIIDGDIMEHPPKQGRGIYELKGKGFELPLYNTFIRAEVLRDCLSNSTEDISLSLLWKKFNNVFESKGHSPFFVPIVSSYNICNVDFGGHRPILEQTSMYLDYYAPVTNNPMRFNKVESSSEENGFNSHLVFSFINQIAELTKQNKDYVIYGAGRITEKLVNIVQQFEGKLPVSIMDDNPAVTDIEGVKVIRPGEELDLFECIVLGTDTYQQNMKKSISRYYGDNIEVIELGE